MTENESFNMFTQWWDSDNIHHNIHPTSTVCNCFIPFMGLRGFCCWSLSLDKSPAHHRALTDGRWCHARCQLHLRSKSGFSMLLKCWWDSTCSSALLGFEPATFRSLADLLCLLSYSRPIISILKINLLIIPECCHVLSCSQLVWSATWWWRRNSSSLTHISHNWFSL